jgi:hypothetical protein
MMDSEYKFVLTRDPVEATKGISNTRFTKVLEIMLWGFPVRLGNYDYTLVETEDGGFAPVIIINKEERLVQGMPDLSLMYFSELVAKIPDAEYDALLMEYAFSKTLYNKYKQRNV